jgi:hypothetical protein
LIAFAVVASGCGSDGAGDRHAFFDPEDSPLRLDTDFGLGGAIVADGIGDELGLDSQGNLYTVDRPYANRNWVIEVAKYSASGELAFTKRFDPEALTSNAGQYFAGYSISRRCK